MHTYCCDVSTYIHTQINTHIYKYIINTYMYKYINTRYMSTYICRYIHKYIPGAFKPLVQLAANFAGSLKTLQLYYFYYSTS